MLKNKLFSVFCAFLWFLWFNTHEVFAQDSGTLSSDAAVVVQGKSLFEANCKQCHGLDAKIVGPALRGITADRSIPWLVSFIKDSQKLIKSGDAKAKEVFEKHNKIPMPSHDFLKDSEISAILSYLTYDGKETTTPTADAGVADAGSANGLSTDQALIDKGKTLFDGNCKACHAINEQVVGPALKGVTERRTVPWLVNFIKYPQKVIESGDPYAKALYDKYKQFMPNHDFLKDEEVNAILSYVVNGKHGAPQTTTTTTSTTANPEAGAGEAKSQNSGVLTGVIIGLVVLLVLVLAVLTLLASVLSRYLAKERQLNEIDQELVSQQFSLGKFVRSQAFLGTVTFIFVALVAKSLTDASLAIGVQQGYAPEQPIPFSHKLHAGAYEIDCKYCHTSVEKSKQAGIPSANICMNCHNTIKTTSPNMQKIYAAIENDEPIQWVRVHNLPDLAYFNHSQHVKVGGLDCTNCHGDVKNMEVIQQQSILTMGWCVDCHRKTDVNAKGNAYYDKLLELHGTSSKKPLKVEDIGGLECGKCHY